MHSPERNPRRKLPTSRNPLLTLLLLAAYQHYLHHIYHIAPLGFLLSFFRFTDANLFLVLYAVVAYYFSNKVPRGRIRV